MLFSVLHGLTRLVGNLFPGLDVASASLAPFCSKFWSYRAQIFDVSFAKAVAFSLDGNWFAAAGPHPGTEWN